MLVPWKKRYDELRQHIKKQRHYFADKSTQYHSYALFNNHARMWELDHKEGWASKNWCFWTVVQEKILESSLDSKEFKTVSPKGNQPWIFIGRTVAEAKAPILGAPYGKSQLTGKDPDAGKLWVQEKRETEDEMVEWNHQLNGHEFEWISGDSEGQGSLACCSPWGHKESDMTEWLKMLFIWI